jgi:hypothetical protein
MLECCIPSFPTKTDETFVIYRWGGGYASKPGGPRYTFVHRDDDYVLPLKEIETALHHLDLDAAIFWEIVEHSAATEAPASAPPSAD